jgi:HD-like signal output (HDOD) protein
VAASLDKWMQKLWPRELPVLTRTEVELARLAPRADKVSAQEIASIILHDPMMTLNVLQLANSRRSRRFGSEITTVEHAVMMLGVPPFFNHFNKLDRLEQQFQGREKILSSALQVISRSHHAACHAWDWAVLRKDIKAEEVYIAALLADMGELLLWLAEADSAQQIMELVRSQAVSVEAAQQEVLGCSMPDLVQAIGAAWHVPEMLLNLMDHRQSNNPRVLVASLAVMLAHHTEAGWYEAAALADYEAVAALMHMPHEEMVAEIHQTAVRCARHWEWFHVRPAAAWLPLLPGAWPVEQARSEASATPQTVPETSTDACLVPQLQKLEHSMREVASHLDGSLNLHDMLSLVMKGMRDGIALNRVVFALLSADQGTLKAKYVVGAEADSPLRKLELDMDGKHLFARLMEKMQGLWYRAANRATLDPLIPDFLRQQIGDGEFFAMSVFVRGKPVGLFYADRKHGSCELDEHSYEEFKQLCLRAAQGLAHLAKT